MANIWPIGQSVLFVSTRAPLSSDDLRTGVRIGYYWLNTSTEQWWICRSNAIGGAVWRDLLHGSTLATSPSSGSENAEGLVVHNLASFRARRHKVKGAIVFRAPSSGEGIVHTVTLKGTLFEETQTSAGLSLSAFKGVWTPNYLRPVHVNGSVIGEELLFGQNDLSPVGFSPKFVELEITGHKTQTGWKLTTSFHKGTARPSVRWAEDADGNAALVIGEVDSIWSFPHLSLHTAMLSHGGVESGYAQGWRAELLQSLAGFSLENPVGSSNPTTLAGFGILDGALIGHKHSWADLTSGLPTTLGGYGITDAQPLSPVLTELTSITTGAGADPADCARNLDLGSAAFTDTTALVGFFSAEITANYSLASTDWRKLLFATSGAPTYTLPPAATLPAGWHCWVKARGTTISVVPSGSDTVDGTSSVSVTTGVAVCIVRTGSTSFEVV